ncbi:MAG TPA: mechanosensitive ion channel domain-containing protein [Xanthobacteraceae bacterium]|nr:mechanosensitive ion channel domain-containing protein [Xanthobacteraceae bacterium]
MDTDSLQDVATSLATTIRETLRTELTSAWLPIQLGAVIASALIALAVAALLRRRFDLTSATMGWSPYLRKVARVLANNVPVLVFILVNTICRAGIQTWAEHPRTYILHIANNLAIAWVVIAILACLIRNTFINRVVAVAAWTIAALSIVGLLDNTVAALDSRALVIGGLRVTPLLVIKTTVLLLVALWIGSAISNFLDRRLQAAPELTPSVQVLLGKLIRIAVMTVAVVIVLSAVGIDLSVLAVFGGAVGVGIGFGLQKIVSNFVSGLILLADKSIKPGDVIAVGDRAGRVQTMGARYTSVDARDGREYLIPNEDLVTQRVVNWSYSSNLVRVDVKFNATYATDPRKTQTTAVAAVLEVPRVLKRPAPACHVIAFGSTSIEYELWFWIEDPMAGVTNVRSEVLLALWDAFEREGVAIPKPGATRVILEQAT